MDGAALVSSGLDGCGGVSRTPRGFVIGRVLIVFILGLLMLILYILV